MKHWLSHLLFVGFYRLVVVLPQSWVMPMSGGLARLTVALGLGRKIVMRNLEIAFGDRMSLAERRKLYRDSIRSTWLTALEVMWMARRDREWVRQRARIHGWEHVEGALQRGRGVLMLGGHFGNFELHNAAMALASKGLYHSFTGRQRNPYLENFVTRLRTHAGVQPVPRSPEAARRMIQILKDNHLMGISADLNTRKGRAPMFVPFFGKLASVPEGMATLAVKSDCPVLFSWITRTGPFQHEIFIKPLPYTRTGSLHADRESLARNFLQAMEAIIRERPADYIWVQKRYRTRPPSDPEPVY